MVSRIAYPKTNFSLHCGQRITWPIKSTLPRNRWPRGHWHSIRSFFSSTDRIPVYRPLRLFQAANQNRLPSPLGETLKRGIYLVKFRKFANKCESVKGRARLKASVAAQSSVATDAVEFGRRAKIKGISGDRGGRPGQFVDLVSTQDLKLISGGQHKRRPAGVHTEHLVAAGPG